jgi:hypothetical protein
MSAVQCFLLEPTDQVQQWLRRYAGEHGDCPVNGYHNARVRIEDAPAELSESGTYLAGHDNHSHDDPRWPKKCECGYRFKKADEWQLFRELIYTRSDNGEEVTLQSAPPGAMWNAKWMKLSREQGYKGPGEFVGPDGRCLYVKLPDNSDWCVDGPATNGPGWKRTGTPPNVTAWPSIGTHNQDGTWRYHGWLRDGQLVEA